MVFGDAESSSGVKREFNRHKDPKAKMTTNSDKNTKKTMQIPYQLICKSKYCFKTAQTNRF